MAMSPASKRIRMEDNGQVNLPSVQGQVLMPPQMTPGMPIPPGPPPYGVPLQQQQQQQQPQQPTGMGMSPGRTSLPGLPHQVAPQGSPGPHQLPLTSQTPVVPGATSSQGPQAGFAPPPQAVFISQQTLLASLDDEDLVGAVDELDSISARDISTLRYARHHEWMEQVLGTVYSSEKIISPSLYSAIPSGATVVNVWGGLDKLKERVTRMEEDANSVDEFYTRSMVEIKEMRNRTLEEFKAAQRAEEKKQILEEEAEDDSRNETN
ncbi:uncharacterized protein V1516DRAFT_664658 [Lipomyces oligophaga]|uniref:uncharacterized protein n=1 Tax=Lipomyces oligophaga TaxID=45792 RepID=UPI0034D016F2